MKAAVNRWKRKAHLFIDQYRRTTWFAGIGLFGFLCLVTGSTLENVYGAGKAEPFVGVFGDLGLLLLIGLACATPIALTHWIITD